MFVTHKVKEKNNIKLYNYWNTLRKGNRVPHRFEVDPSQISDLLSETFILENENCDAYQFRLAGTKICRQFGRELKNTNLLTLWDRQDDCLILHELLNKITQDAAVGVCQFTAVAQNGKSVDYEMLVLPLMHYDHAISRLLGTMVASSEPYWLGVSPFENFQLRTIETFWPYGGLRSVVLHNEVATHNESKPSNVTSLHSENYKLITSKDRRFRVYEGGLNISEDQ